MALVRGFRVEQTDPDRFYSLMAQDSVRMVEEFGPVRDRTVLDVGAGRVQFATAFAHAGAAYVAVDPDAGDRHGAGLHVGSSILGKGEGLPVRDGSVDVTFASNVLEHVPRPGDLGAELVRVTRAGGLVVVSYTNWLSPWGGHETSPFHYLGGDRAVRRYTRHYGRPPKNRVGETLFRVSVADGLAWARNQQGTELLAARPRYYPRWMSPLVLVPGVRELATWNLLLVLRRT